MPTLISTLLWESSSSIDFNSIMGEQYIDFNSIIGEQ